LSGLRKELKHGLHVRLLSFCLLSEWLFLSFQLGRGTAVIEPAFLLVVAEVATASFRQAFPWFGVTAADDRPSSFSPEEKSENPRRQ